MTYLLLFFCLQEPALSSVSVPGAPSVQLTPRVVLGTAASPLAAQVVATVGADGAVFVLDPAACRVEVYGRDGVRVRGFGSRGQEDGAFTGPDALGVGPDGDVYVFDVLQAQVARFTPDGRYREAFPLDPQIRNINAPPTPAADGRWAMSIVRRDEGGQFHYEVVLLEADFSRGPLRASLPLPTRNWGQAGAPSFWAQFMNDIAARNLAGYPDVAMGAHGHVLVTEPGTRQFAVYNAAGEEVGVVSWDHAAPALPLDMRRAHLRASWDDMRLNPDLAGFLSPAVQALAEEAPVPEDVGPVLGVVPLARRFGVVARGPLPDQAVLGIFDATGVPLATVPLPGKAPVRVTGAGKHLLAVSAVPGGAVVTVYTLHL